MLLGFLLIFGLVGFDQLIKIISLLTKNESSSLIKVLIPKILEFHYIENTGASFGMLEGAQFLFAIVTILSLIFFGYLFIQSNFKTKLVYSLGITLIIAGTFGNAVDRLFRNGAVIDMFNMPLLNTMLESIGIGGFIYNIADLYMTVGIILFIIDILFLERKRVDKNAKESKELTS